MGMAYDDNQVLTPRATSAAMAMATLRAEKPGNCHVMGFARTFIPLDFNEHSSLNEVTKKISGLPFGATDCSRPMNWAMDNNVKADVFIVYTDSETNAHKVSPAKTMEKYRAWSGIQDAKLIVVGVVASEFSIADPADPNMLDVVGFDSNAPSVMSSFVRGEL
jgi:60 kDa SS-A/Ro ribonucleoprotein